jgi:hypothetical protein
MPSVWYIYHVKKYRYAKPKPKDKFVVIALRDTKPWGFFINTDIRQFVRNRPELLACQVSIKASSHKCLNHDSYVDCTELFPFEDTELTDIKDKVDKQTQAEIKKAVAISKTLVVRHQKIILAD